VIEWDNPRVQREVCDPGHTIFIDFCVNATGVLFGEAAFLVGPLEEIPTVPPHRYITLGKRMNFFHLDTDSWRLKYNISPQRILACKGKLTFLFVKSWYYKRDIVHNKLVGRTFSDAFSGMQESLTGWHNKHGDLPFECVMLDGSEMLQIPKITDMLKRLKIVVDGDVAYIITSFGTFRMHKKGNQSVCTVTVNSSITHNMTWRPIIPGIVNVQTVALSSLTSNIPIYWAPPPPPPKAVFSVVSSTACSSTPITTPSIVSGLSYTKNVTYTSSYTPSVAYTPSNTSAASSSLYVHAHILHHVFLYSPASWWVRWSTGGGGIWWNSFTNASSGSGGFSSAISMLSNSVTSLATHTFAAQIQHL